MKPSILRYIIVCCASVVLALLLNYFFTTRVFGILGFYGAQVYIPAIIFQIILIYEILIFFVKGWSLADKIILTMLYLAILIIGLFCRVSLGDSRYDLNPLSFISNAMRDHHAIFLAFLNVLLFIPLPIIISFFKSEKRLMLASFCTFAISVETLQMITQRGIFDIGDILLYVIGFIIGVNILQYLNPLMIGKNQINIDNNN